MPNLRSPASLASQIRGFPSHPHEWFGFIGQKTQKPTLKHLQEQAYQLSFRFRSALACQPPGGVSVNINIVASLVCKSSTLLGIYAV